MPDFPLPHLDIPGLGQGLRIAPACRRLALGGRDFGLKKSSNFSLLKLPE
jgi:hypothetical protein